MKNLVKLAFVVSVFIYGNLAFGQSAATQAPATTKPAMAPQAKMTPDERAQKRADQLKTRLGLSDDQTTKVKDIYMKNETSRSAAMQAAGQDKDARATAMKKNREDLDNELAKVFTADQLKKYKDSQPKAAAAPAATPAAGTTK